MGHVERLHVADDELLDELRAIACRWEERFPDEASAEDNPWSSAAPFLHDAQIAWATRR